MNVTDNTVIDLKKHNDEKVTVLTASYLPDKDRFTVCAESMLNQRHTGWEWHIGFDGEKSFFRAEKFPIYQKLMNDYRVHIHTEKKHIGVSRIRNILLDKVQSGYVGFLDDDNWFNTDTIHFIKKVIAQATIMNEQMNVLNPKVAIMIGQIVLEKPAHIKIEGIHSVQCRPARRYCFDEIVQGNKIDLGQIWHTVNTDIRFCEKMTRLVDWDYYLQMIAQEYKQIPFDVFMSYYDNMSRINRISCTEDYVRNHCRLLWRWKDRLTKLMVVNNINPTEWFSRLPYKEEK